MYSVLYEQCNMWNWHISVGEAVFSGNAGRLDAYTVCGDSVLWRGIYITDYRAERNGSHSGVFDSEPGICDFSHCRLDSAWTGAEPERNLWLCACVYRNCTRKASAKKISQFFRIFPFSGEITYFLFIIEILFAKSSENRKAL